MRRFAVALLLALSVVSMSAAASTKSAAKASSKHEKTPVATKGVVATGVTDATVAACTTEFVEALNSLDDERVLSALAASDRISLRGHANLIGSVFGKKILNPQVKAFEKLEKDGKVLGAKATVTVDEVDPIEGTKAAKDHVWFLSLDEKNTLKVSLSSIWLDTGRVGAGE